MAVYTQQSVSALCKLLVTGKGGYAVRLAAGVNKNVGNRWYVISKPLIENEHALGTRIWDNLISVLYCINNISQMEISLCSAAALD